jgi:hypothetical protein
MSLVEREVMKNHCKVALSLAVLLFGLQTLSIAAADDHDRGRVEARPQVRGPGPAARPTFDGRGQVLDSRYNHGRYYPPIGTIRPNLPLTYRPYYRGGERFYFDGGVWYAPRGPGFVIVRPPIGLVIGVLPPYYSTVWFGGVPYYYADNVYYVQQPDQNGYAVVDPPDNADEPSSPPDNAQMPQADLIIYPKNGQSKDQQSADQYECHNWAKGQTGFDPTQPGGGTSGNPDVNRSNYNRAMSACLQGRGYQVN